MMFKGVKDEFDRDGISAVVGCVVQEKQPPEVPATAIATLKCLTVLEMLSRNPSQLAALAQTRTDTIDDILPTLSRIDREAGNEVARKLRVMDERAALSPEGPGRLETTVTPPPPPTGRQALFRIADALERLGHLVKAVAWAALVLAVVACIAALIGITGR
jgi:hypothetical protein